MTNFWNSSPLFAKLFFIYLAGACSFVLITMARLVVYFGLLTIRKKRSLWSALGDETNPSDIALLVFTKQLSIDPRSKDFATTGKSLLLRLRESDVAFDYLCARLRSEILLVMRLAVLTVLLTCFIVAYGGFSTWSSQFSTGNITGYQAFLVASEVIFSRIALGFGLAALLWLISSYFEILLNRRSAEWKYFIAFHSESPLPPGLVT